MTKDEVIRMAREAGYDQEDGGVFKFDNFDIERFAALVAAHALANIDPSKLMSYQEGYEAGRTAERERLLSTEIHSCHADCQRFACVQTRKAVEAEREACAKVAEEEIARVKPLYSVTAENIVKQIRARGEVK